MERRGGREGGQTVKEQMESNKRGREGREKEEK